MGTNWQRFVWCLTCVCNKWLPLLFMVTPSVLFRVCCYWCIRIPPPDACTISWPHQGRPPLKLGRPGQEATGHNFSIFGHWVKVTGYSVSQSGMCLWHRNRSTEQIVWNKIDILKNCTHLRKWTAIGFSYTCFIVCNFSMFVRGEWAHCFSE